MRSVVVHEITVYVDPVMVVSAVMAVVFVMVLVVGVLMVVALFAQVVGHTTSLVGTAGRVGDFVTILSVLLQ